MVERVEPREAEEFFLNVPEKLNDRFPDLAYFRENHLVFFYPPLEQWFVSGTMTSLTCPTTPGSAPTG